MRTYAQRLSEAKGIYEAGLERVSTTPEPNGQKFRKGTFVDIAEDLGCCMQHFHNGIPARVEYTYAHAYWGNDINSYSLLVRGESGHWRSVAWYDEQQLTEIKEAKRIKKYQNEIKLQSKKEGEK
jgi:hypothetical protein